jgi:prepilin-type N-terminal cleavage/methylation domain-containing protein
MMMYSPLKSFKKIPKEGGKMRSLFRKTHKGQKGFTLVEVLVVFTLLGVLAAIILPSVSGVLSYSHDQAADAELATVQTAVDAMMAVTDNATMVLTGPTNDMTDFPTGIALFPKYLRSATTHLEYSVDADGTVSTVDTW